MGWVLLRSIRWPHIRARHVYMVRAFGYVEHKDHNDASLLYLKALHETILRPSCPSSICDDYTATDLFQRGYVLLEVSSNNGVYNCLEERVTYYL